jgi:tRNA(Ile)-lysidine synthase
MSALAAALLTRWPLEAWRDCRLLVAVSGGPDSVALLRALAALSQSRPSRLFLAHFDHALRGAESRQERGFCLRLAQQLGIAPLVGQQAVDAPVHSEAGLRAVRYRFLEQAARACRADFVVTGHTADDQAETVLLNLLRGCGLQGLSGIPSQRRLGASRLVRPLLGCSRAMVIEYLEELDQPWCSDSSNLTRRYSRNRLRRRLLPWLERQVHPGARAALLRTADLAGQWQACLQTLGEQWLSESVRLADGLLHIACPAPSPPSLWPVRQVGLVLAWQQLGWPLQAMSQQHWGRLRQLLESPPGGRKPTRRFHLPGGLEVTARGGEIIIRPIAADPDALEPQDFPTKAGQ